MHRGRRVRLHRETGRHRAPAFPSPHLAAPLKRFRPLIIPNTTFPPQKRPNALEGRIAMVFANTKQESAHRTETAKTINGGSASSGKDEATTSILIVDDTPEKLLATEAVLADLGQKIVKARNGREALKAVLKEDFAVI